jgi:hypothetical protein
MVQCSGTEARTRFWLQASAISAFAMTAASIGFIIVRWLVSRIEHPGEVLFIPSLGMSGTVINPLDPDTFVRLEYLFVIASIASFCLIFLSALAGRLLGRAAVWLFKFGAERMERVGRLVTATIAVIAGLFALWSAFGAP